METKGDHLLGNADSKYKKELSRIFSETKIQKNWQKLLEIDNPKKVFFKFVGESELGEQVNEIFV